MGELTPPSVTRSGFVALAGRPNVGKSTLANAIVGAKVAIVSDKPQTTRRAIRGVANGPGWQLILVDLPGVQRPRDALVGVVHRTVDWRAVLRYQPVLLIPDVIGRFLIRNTADVFGLYLDHRIHGLKAAPL